MNEIEDYLKPSSRFHNYEIPLNIDRFIEKSFRSMFVYVGNKTKKSRDDINSIINGFIIHMFEKDDFGRVRYERYDSSKYPDVPYLKWFLNNLKYYVKNHWRSLKKSTIYNEESLDIDKFDYEDQDIVSYSVSCFDKQDSIVFLNEVYTFLESYSMNKIKSFDFNAYTLFKLKMEGYSNRDLAKEFRVIPLTINSWLNKLRYLLYKNLDIDVLFEDRGLYIKNLIRT